MVGVKRYWLKCNFPFFLDFVVATYLYLTLAFLGDWAIMRQHQWSVENPSVSTPSPPHRGLRRAFDRRGSLAPASNLNVFATVLEYFDFHVLASWVGLFPDMIIALALGALTLRALHIAALSDPGEVPSDYEAPPWVSTPAKVVRQRRREAAAARQQQQQQELKPQVSPTTAQSPGHVVVSVADSSPLRGSESIDKTAGSGAASVDGPASPAASDASVAVKCANPTHLLHAPASAVAGGGDLQGNRLSMPGTSGPSGLPVVASRNASAYHYGRAESSRRAAFEPHYCSTCEMDRPLRTHHCRYCNTCVVRFDHHCDWIDNCVGHRNHKCFMLFITYIFCCIVHFLSMMLHYFTTKSVQLEPDAWTVAHIVILCIYCMIVIPCALLALFFLCNTAYQLCLDETTIESTYPSRYPTKGMAGKSLVRRIKSVMGDRVWLWWWPDLQPLKLSPGDVVAGTIGSGLTAGDKREEGAAAVPASATTNGNGADSNLNGDATPAGSAAADRRGLIHRHHTV